MMKEMINSNFPSHHFYLIYFKSQSLASVDSFLNFLPVYQKSVVVPMPKTDGCSFTFAQLILDRAYGTDTAMQVVEKDGKKYYLYDIYAGETSYENERYYFLCYPYNRLSKEIDNYFKARIKKIIYKPEVQLVLTYMQERLDKGTSEIEKVDLNVDISRYSAEITEDASANKINISGSNPLNSQVFNLLQKKENNISLKPIALKLKCGIDEVGLIELAFDRIGNMRFWLRQNAHEDVFAVVPSTFVFFKQIGAFSESPYINSHTLLEDEQQ